MPAVSPPRWARVIDFLCLALFLLAVLIALFGGFRMRIGGLRIALTSPYRTLAWAIAIGVARHLIAPATPIYRDAPARVFALMRTDAARIAATVLVATRVSVLVVGILAVFSIGYREDAPPWRLIEIDELRGTGKDLFTALVNLQARFKGIGRSCRT